MQRDLKQMQKWIDANMNRDGGNFNSDLDFIYIHVSDIEMCYLAHNCI